MPENREEDAGSADEEGVARARHEAAEIIARAQRQAESIIADATSSSAPVPSPLAALGDNADEIIGQVRKLIKNQREMQSERQGLLDEIEELKSERDELVQRLTDAVERMEELARMADMAQSGEAPPPPPAMSSSPPPPPPMPTAPPRPRVADEPMPAADEDTSLAARLRQAEEAESAEEAQGEDSSLAARLERAERERNARAEAGEDELDTYEDEEGMLIAADGRSFYDRHSAKLPRLEGDGGRSVLSAIGDMRPESEPKGRKGRRRGKK
ncbi:MAG: hypothetical protein QNJ81_03855 [Acidimicrobiia bacterium]|nr:hypothetical protein [Acidimicrobiia bacterium]